MGRRGGDGEERWRWGGEVGRRGVGEDKGCGCVEEGRSGREEGCGGWEEGMDIGVGDE